MITLTKRKDQTTTIRGLSDADLRLLSQCLDCFANKAMFDAHQNRHDGFEAMAQQLEARAGMVARFRDALAWVRDRYDNGELELVGGQTDPADNYIVNNRRAG